MKILHIGPPLKKKDKTLSYAGGLNRFLIELTEEQKRTHNVQILNPSIQIFSKVEKAVKSHNFEALRQFGEELIFKCDADIVHIHDWYGAIVIDYLYESNVRNIVMTSHLPLRRGFTYKDSTLSWRYKTYLEDRALHAAIKITVPSSYTKNFLLSEYGISTNKISVIPHGVDKTFFNNKERINKDFPSILFVGRLTEQKSPELLLRAFKIVVDKYVNAKFYIVGRGSQYQRLLQIADDLQLNNNVIFDFAEDKEKLKYYYNMATLLVFPSQFEPFGLIGLEAMASGCPVLAISPTGAEEYLTTNELIKCLSPTRIGDAIIKHIEYLKTEKNYDYYRTRAKKWNWQTSSKMYDEIYKEVVR